MENYPFKATYEISERVSKNKLKKQLLTRLAKYTVKTKGEEKKKLANKLYGLSPGYFSDIMHFRHADNRSVIFIEKRSLRVVLNLFSNSPIIFRDHMTCLEEKVISNPKGITRFIPTTFYPVEYLSIYVNNILLERVPRRKMISKYLTQSMMLYISPLIIVFYKNILKLEVPELDYRQAVILLITYTLITIFVILSLKKENHAVKLH